MYLSNYLYRMHFKRTQTILAKKYEIECLRKNMLYRADARLHSFIQSIHCLNPAQIMAISICACISCKAGTIQTHSQKAIYSLLST